MGVKHILLLILLLTPAALAWPALPLKPVEIEVTQAFFNGNDTIVYLEDLETGMVFGVNPERCLERHPPFSSFKIPNMLIALETGTVEGLESPIPYDPTRRPEAGYWPPDWAQDQTLKSAFQRSAAWAFQDLALQIGNETYQGYLDHFTYGNGQASGDAFWLDRSLEVSPKEQVDFLRKLLTGQLEVAPLHVDLLRDAAEIKEQDGLTLYGKTGAGPVRANDFEGEFEGWFVGWLERPDTPPVLFALWTKGDSYQAIKDYRRKATEQILEQAGYLPLSW
jgi:beta-lactamase class D